MSDENKIEPLSTGAELSNVEEQNYLGDPATIEWLLRSYAKDCLDRLGENFDNRDTAAQGDMDAAYKIADILLGKDPAYPPLEGWNTPGVIDKWLLEQQPQLNPTTPEETVARTLVIFLCRIYDLTAQCQDNPQDSDQMLVDAIVSEFLNLLLGNPQWNDTSE